ncbi:MAG: hypothetical protein V3U28_08400, partial [Candidatus Acidoferrales bacterium]
RQRILEAFFDGTIGKDERDRRFEEIGRELLVYEQLLTDSDSFTHLPILDFETISAIVDPFAEWEFLNRNDRRVLLRELCPEISVYRYEIRHLALNIGSGHEVNHEKTAWSPSPGPSPA